MPLLSSFAVDAVTENASNQSASNKDAVVVTTLALTTAAGATHTLTHLGPNISPNSIIDVQVGNGTNTAGTAAVGPVTPSGTVGGPGSVAIVIQNIHASNAFNGTLKITIIIWN